MGVHDLETFIKREVPNGFVEVNVMAKVKDFKRIFKKRPILIFDVMSIVSYICENKIEILCGGCFDLYHFHLEQLFSALKAQSDLYFFLDGYVQMDTKFNTWQKRQNDKYKESISIIDKINHNYTVDEIARNHGKIYANTMLNVIESVAIKFGTLRYAVSAECDKEIAQFATNQWRTLAVFSDDSDFLIFGGNWRYFSMKHLNSATFITMEYNRPALKTFLALTEFQMSIFATCLGNDIICNKSLKSFHKKFNNRALDIAKFIREKIKDLKTHSDVVNLLVKAIFGVDNDYYKELLNTSIKSYFISHDEIKNEGPFDYLLQYHMLFTRNVLSDAPFNFSLVFYDLIEYPKSYFDISIKLLERQAGIVFAQTLIDPFPLKIYSKKSHKLPYQLYEANPIMPPFEVIPMTKIHSTDEIYNNHRMTLLAWIVCWEKLSHFDLQQVPSKFMIDVLTLTYLIQNSLITSKEADLILYSIKRTDQKKVFPRPPLRLDPRAFHIAFLYTRMYANVQRSIEVCGLQHKYGKPLSFNGIDFHNLYNIFKDKEFDPKTYLGNIH